MLRKEPTVLADVRSTIAATNERFKAHVARGDAAGIAALYCPDAMILPPNSDFVRGESAVRQFWQSLFEAGLTDLDLEIVEVEAVGDTAVEISTYTTYTAGSEVTDRGKYLIVWKYEDGAWRLFRDIFNSSMPAQ